MATSIIKPHGIMYRLRKTYTNVIIPSNHYVKIDSYDGLGIPSSMYVISMNIRGWGTTTPYNVIKGGDATSFYLIGDVGTVDTITVEYFLARSTLVAEWQ